MQPFNFFLIFLFLVLPFWVKPIFASERFEFEQPHMGVPVRIIIYTESRETAENAVKAAFEQFRVLNEIMSDYDSESELSRICEQNSSRNTNVNTEQTIAISISNDLFIVLKSAKYYSTISNGAFDVTVSPFVRLWRRSRRQGELPKQTLLDQAKERVGNHLWELDEINRQICFLQRGVRLDLGGIAKGYAIDKAFEILQKFGIDRILIDAGGDMRLGEPPPNEIGWKVNLNNEETILLKNIALATSGDRFQFVEINGVRYSHLIDPKTGLGLTTPCVVHVAAKTAMDADALASAVAILGQQKGIELAEKSGDVAVKMIVYPAQHPIPAQTKSWNFPMEDLEKMEKKK